jgi:DNA-binding NtrC family response regulator
MTVLRVFIGRVGLMDRIAVLIVDDEPLIADSLAIILTQNGYHAVACHDAEMALKRLSDIRPDVLITDIVLPRMNGIDLAIKIKKGWPDCKVLLFSGQYDIDHLLALSHISKYDFGVLNKPLSPAMLLKHLDIVLGKSVVQDF